MFQGFCTLEDTAVEFDLLVKNSSGVPVNADSLPTFRVYGPDGVMLNGTGSASLKDTGSISGASNTSPIVVTSANHGLSTGSLVTITGALGNTAANGTFTVTSLTSSTFSLVGSTGNGAWTSGGTWNVTGLYKLTVDTTSANGYVAGSNYAILASAAISSTAWGNLDIFTVT